MIGWVLDKSAAARISAPLIEEQVAVFMPEVYVCPMGLLEQLYSSQSARNYDQHARYLSRTYKPADVPHDILDRALALQRDLAHHHGMWHRIPIPDLIIAETALFHGHGVLHVDADYDRIAEVRPLTARRLG